MFGFLTRRKEGKRKKSSRGPEQVGTLEEAFEGLLASKMRLEILGKSAHSSVPEIDEEGKAKIQLRKKFDVSIYLAFITVPFLVLLCGIWFVSGISGILVVHNAFPVAFTAANSFSFFPLIIYGLWKERREYCLWQMMPLLFLVTAYTYHWIPCLASALIKIVTRKPVWEKTRRFSNAKRGLDRRLIE